MDEIEATIKGIKELKIQGARTIAKTSLQLMKLKAQKWKGKNVNALLSSLIELADTLASLRPTEPMTRNLLSELLADIEMKQWRDTESLKKFVSMWVNAKLREIKRNLETLIEIGANFIPQDCIVATHCHSSTVISILKRASDMEKKIKVINFETRPVYQGRKTARELANYGIEVEHYVDSAMFQAIKDVDLVLVGGDAVTSYGGLINKIGTGVLAHLAFYYDIPFYSAVETAKVERFSIFGRRIKIEERNAEEVWNIKHKRIKVRNPAFDLIQPKYITGFITEKGILSPHVVSLLFAGEV